MSERPANDDQGGWVWSEKKKMADAYEVVGSSLKLKGVQDGGVKKKLDNKFVLNYDELLSY